MSERHGMRWVATLMVLGLVLAACQAKPAYPSGEFATTLAEADVPSAVPAEFVPLLVGGWSVRFEEGGQANILKEGQVVAQGSYLVNADELAFGEDTGPMSCSADGVNEGKYQWQLEGDTLTFTAVADDCLGRYLVLTSHPLERP